MHFERKLYILSMKFNFEQSSKTYFLGMKFKQKEHLGTFIGCYFAKII